MLDILESPAAIVFYLNMLYTCDMKAKLDFMSACDLPTTAGY